MPALLSGVTEWLVGIT